MQLISIGQFHKVIEKYLYWLSLPSIGFTDILEIIIISVIVYQMLKWVQLTRAWTLFKGIIMLLLFALFAAIFQLNTISWLLSNSLGVGITAAIIIFQPVTNLAESLSLSNCAEHSRSRRGTLWKSSWIRIVSS